MSHKYGWRADNPDHRDHFYAAHFLDLLRLPASIDLRPLCPDVYDQGALGSCTSQAIAAALEFDMLKQSEQAFTPSRLFIYYNERAKEGTVASDAGAAIRDGIKSVNRQGACPESEWPYDVTQFAVEPPQQCYQDALLHRSLSYSRVPQHLSQIKAALFSGLPVVFGFSVYDSFESAEVAQSGVVPMPGPGESLLGGHAVLAVGYRDDEQLFMCRNSWGAGWGMAGYFTMPYAYLLSAQLASDFWVIKTVE